MAKPGSAGERLAAKLSCDAQIKAVPSFDEALIALRDDSYDLIISDQSDFIALERAAVNQQSAMILETIGQGVCIIGLDGRLIWANPKMRTYPEDLMTQVCEVSRRSFGAAPDPEAAGASGPPQSHRARRVSLTAGPEHYFEVTMTPVMNHQNQVRQVAAVVWDVTTSRRLQKKLDAIDMAGRDLVRLDAEAMAGLNVEERIQLLEQKMLRYMHDLLHFDNFAVLLIDKKTNRMEFVLQHGMTPQGPGLRHLRLKRKQLHQRIRRRDGP
jgi:hypothetical protein